MIKDKLEFYSLSLVFVGEFNPAIIQPFWLSSKQLIREREANDARIEVIHPELVRFDIDWAFFEITHKRLEIRTTKEPYFKAVRDLGISIFKILKETPVNMLGINHNMHYAIDNQDKYFQFGDKLAPLENWDGIFNEPKLLNLEIVETQRTDSYTGLYRVKVNPSDVLSQIKYGVAIDLNNHFDFTKSEDKKKDLSNILINEWDKSFELADSISENLWNKLQK